MSYVSWKPASLKRSCDKPDQLRKNNEAIKSYKKFDMFAEFFHLL